MTVVSVETLEKLKQIRLRRMTCVFYSLLRVSILSFSNMCKLGLRINDDNIHWACNLIKEKVCFMISSLCLCNIFKWKCVSITMLWVLLDTSICSLICIYMLIYIECMYIKYWLRSTCGQQLFCSLEAHYIVFICIMWV